MFSAELLGAGQTGLEKVAVGAMARKAAWEDLADADLGAQRPARATPWGRVLVALLLVALVTFVAAYYLPLHLAHEKLGQKFRELDQRSVTLGEQLSTAQRELKAASERRDQLQAEQAQREATKQSDAERLARARTALAGKLDRVLKKGSAALATRPGALLVAFDSGTLFLPQKLELTSAARLLVCEVAKVAQPKAIAVHAVLAEAEPPPSPLSKSYPPPWGLSAARAASVAQVLATSCGLGGTQLSANGDGDHDLWASELASSKLPPDRVELELHF